MLAKAKKYLLSRTIPVLKLQGGIDANATAQVVRSLAKIDASRAEALAFVINTRGGSGAQSEIIIDKVKSYCHSHHLPLYTFAEDICASAGYYILSIGDKIYVDNSSLVGSIGVVGQHASVKKLLEKNKFEIRSWATNEESWAYNFHPYQALTDKARQEHLEVTKKLHAVFIDHIERHRGDKIKVPKDKRLDEIYNGNVWVGKDSINLGLADELGTYEQILRKNFPKAELVYVNEITSMERFRSNMKMIMSKFESSEQKASQNQSQFNML